MGVGLIRQRTASEAVPVDVRSERPGGTGWIRLLAALWLMLWTAGSVTAQQAMPSLAPMLENATPAVVNISTERSMRSQMRPMDEQDLRRFFQDGRPPVMSDRPIRAAGSGVIINAAEGYIITNHHVVAGADVIDVVLADDRHFEASLVGSDPQTDIALLKIEADNLTELPLADINQLRVGDYVVAIGNPFGLGQTVTQGIVSALGRSGLNAENYEDFIQTDAAINMGNSGGALVNLNGHLVGINTAIISGSGANTGVGFAVPADMVSAVVEHLERDGEVRRGQLGIQIRDYTPILEQAVGAGVNRGALVMGILPGSAAERAGVEVSDVIVAVDGEPIDSGRELRNIIGLAGTGIEVELELYRNGSSQTVTAVIDEAGDQVADTGRNGQQEERRPNDSIYRGAQLQMQGDGLVVAGVQPQSPAWNAGLRAGDRIVEVNRQPVRDLSDFNRQVSGRNEPTALSVVREDRPLLVIIS